MRKILALPPLVVTLVLALVAPASAAPTRVIVLPGAHSAEAIADGPGTTFYAGDLFAGDIYRGDIRRGTAELFIDVPDGQQADGMDLDQRSDLLYVAGGPGKAYVYDVRTKALVRTYDLGDPNASLINDVTLTPYGAWFTDSVQPKLYFVPIVFGRPGTPRTLNLRGPVAGAPGEFVINDITSTPSGGTLLVSATLRGKLYTINPITGQSREVAGAGVPGADGLVLDGHRLWVVQFDNRVTRWRLTDDFTHACADGEITDPAFGAPVSAEKFGNRLAVVNSHLNTGIPPTSPTYEVVVVNS